MYATKSLRILIGQAQYSKIKIIIAKTKHERLIFFMCFFICLFPVSLDTTAPIIAQVHMGNAPILTKIETFRFPSPKRWEKDDSLHGCFAKKNQSFFKKLGGIPQFEGISRHFTAKLKHILNTQYTLQQSSISDQQSAIPDHSLFNPPA